MKPKVDVQQVFISTPAIFGIALKDNFFHWKLVSKLSSGSTNKTKG